MSDTRRELPAVHSLLRDAEDAGIAQLAPRAVVVSAIRTLLAEARVEEGKSPEEGWLAELERRITGWRRPSLLKVVNATGVILHTNLGRAPLSESAREAAADALGYSSLEYELEAGERGSRQDHTRSLLQEITGAEEALVVNNAAAALLLVINTLAEKRDTIVSRGELVEIGGSFRLPEILAKSGSVLHEVGTTNRTHLRDYQQAISPQTGCVLKVHRSNFRLSGFVTEVSVEELVNLFGARGIAAVHDVGSGLLVDLSDYGLTGEPLVQDSVRAGAVTVFSGDKLIGGPQAGIVVGPDEVIKRAAKNPLARAIRADKTTIAALQATLALYRDRSTALSEVPALAMLTADPKTLERRAAGLASTIKGAATESGFSSVGGGSFPEIDLPTTLVSAAVDRPEEIAAKMRQRAVPVIVRTAPGKILLDVRTIRDDEFQTVAVAVKEAL